MLECNIAFPIYRKERNGAGERTYVFFLPPFFPLLIRLFLPTAILPPQPPPPPPPHLVPGRLGAREVEWLRAAALGVSRVFPATGRVGYIGEGERVQG